MWVKKDIEFRFQLGRYTIFKIKLDGIDFIGHFTQFPSDIITEVSKGQLLKSNIHAIAIRSYPVDRPLPKLSIVSGYIRYVRRQYRRYYVDIAGSFEEYLKGFRAKSKSRSKFLKRVRRFKALSGGEIKWHIYKLPGEVDDFCNYARAVWQKTYERCLSELGVSNEEEFKEKVRHIAETDLMRGYILFYSGKPISYLYSYAPEYKKGVLLCSFMGFNPEYWNFSPGMILQYLALEGLFQEKKFIMFDFTEGGGLHKSFFATGSKTCADIYFIKPGFGNFLIVVLHIIFETMTKMLRMTLEILRFKSHIKKFLRKHI